MRCCQCRPVSLPGAPHSAPSFPGCSPWYVAEVQDSLCSLHTAQGRRPQGSERIPVQRRGMRGSRGAWRFQPNAAGCSLAACSAARLQAAGCAPDLQARWGSCFNPIFMTGQSDSNQNMLFFPFQNTFLSENHILIAYPHTCRLPRSHGVLRVPATVRRAGAAPHQEARQELHREGREESKSVSERGATCAARACAQSRAKINVVGRELHYICPWFVSSQLTEK